MTDQSGPRHGDDSVYDPNPDTAYDDDYAIDPEAGAAGAGAAGAGAAGAGAAGGTGGPPLRGLAMVLTAVAVILIAWGIYAVVGGDDDETDTAGATQSQSAGQDDASDADSDAASSPQDGADAGASDDAAASGAEGENGADGADGTDGAASGDDGGDGAEGAGDEPSAGEVDRAATAVTVLNNSGEPVAQSTADRLRGEQWTNIGYGNLRGRIDGISEESRVYYPEGNAQSQAAAEQVAGDLGISAAAGNPDYYNRFGEADVRNGPKADGVVVVLTGPL